MNRTSTTTRRRQQQQQPNTTTNAMNVGMVQHTNNNVHSSGHSSTFNHNSRLASTDCDDGDYDVDERGGGGAKRHHTHTATNDAEFLGQEVEHGLNDNDNNNDNDDCMDDDILRGMMEGSDASSEEQYRDRNSDPGVDVQHHDDAEYLLTPPSATIMSSYNQQHNPSSINNNMDSLQQQQLVLGAGGNINAKYTNENSMALGIALPHHHPASALGGGVGAAAVGGNESVSLGTATQTHEVRMPMLLSTFKPASGCTNASDFIVRCFVARLRSGITVVKHGRRRWCKSRLRILHVHTDGRSLSWKPALGEPSSGKAPPKLDLATCMEVRHAWSPDPDNPMFTGTPILRQKCEAANAHKSFALIFPKRTVDITAVTADQCKVLMEGFSALCFRLQVAQNVARSSGNQTGTGVGCGEGGKGGGDGLLEDKTTTESVTLTNPSLKTTQDSPKNKQKKGRMSFR